MMFPFGLYMAYTYQLFSVFSSCLWIKLTLLPFFTEKSEFVKDQIQNNDDHEGSEDDLDLPLFALSTLEFATETFSKRNKIGEGGFGPVYWVISTSQS